MAFEVAQRFKLLYLSIVLFLPFLLFSLAKHIYLNVCKLNEYIDLFLHLYDPILNPGHHLFDWIIMAT